MPYKDKEKQREAQRKWEKENRGAGKRHKVWMFIFYPDTAEVGWRDECDELGLPFLVSPLHDRDVWTAADERRNPDHIEGEVKVAHYHGLVEYPQPVDYDTVKEDFAFLHTHSIKYAKSKMCAMIFDLDPPAVLRVSHDAPATLAELRYEFIAVRLDERGVAHIADALDRQNPRLALDARDSVEELRKLKVSHLGALAFTRPAQHGYVPLHG